MNKVCMFSFFLLLSFLSFGQSKTINSGGIEMKISAADSSINELFCCVGIMPEYPGGMKKAVAFAKRNLVYPQKAVKDSIQGPVVLEFTIDKKGRLINRKVVQSVRYDVDNVCLRMLAKMPKWEPGRLNGKPVDVNERWKIIFMLTE